MDWQFTQKGERLQLRVKPDLLVNDHEALVSCVRNDMGISQLVGIAVQEELASGELVEVLPRSFRSGLPVSILYPARQHLPSQVRAFVDWCVEVFASTASQWLTVK